VVVDSQGKCGALHDGGGIGGPDPSLRRRLSHRILRSTRLPSLRYSQIAERTNKPPFSGHAVAADSILHDDPGTSDILDGCRAAQLD
jgi:hypothetical protein